jgi:hypothetical protein
MKLHILLAVTLSMGVLGVMPVAAQAEEPPPIAYSNGKAISATHTAIAGWGPIAFTNTAIKTINCTTRFYGAAWNEGSPSLGHGLVEGWGTNQCTDPEGIKSLEADYKRELEEHKIKCATPGAAVGEGKCITVLFTAEMPLTAEVRQAEVCIDESKRLSECAKEGERETKHLLVAVRRGQSSLPWDAELERCTRNEKEGSCLKTGIPNADEEAKGNTTCYKNNKEGLPVNYTEIPAGCVKISEIWPEIPIKWVYYGTQDIFGENGVKNGLSPSKLKFIESGTLDSPGNYTGEETATGEYKIVGAESLQLIQAR